MKKIKEYFEAIIFATKTPKGRLLLLSGLLVLLGIGIIWWATNGWAALGAFIFSWGNNIQMRYT